MALYSRLSIRVLIIDGSGSEKTNVLSNLIKNEPDIDKIYLYTKDPFESKYQFLINKREIKYSNDMQNVSKNIGEYNGIKNAKY